MRTRGLIAVLAALVAISAPAQASLVEDGSVDDDALPGLPDAPDVDLSQAQDGGDAVADGASGSMAALSDVLAAAGAMIVEGAETAGAILGEAAGTFGAAAADAYLTVAAATASALVAAAVALVDALAAVFTHPAMQDPAARAAAAGAVGATPAAAAGIWAWVKRLGPFAGVPLYSRIDRDDVLDNEIRERIFDYIRDHPGAHTSKIADDLELGWGTTVHHLKHLERHDMISKRKARNHTCYFENGGTFSPREQEALAALKNPKARRIAEDVQRHPGHSQKELANELSLSQSLVSWHVKKLEDAGLIRRERNGKRYELLPTDDLGGIVGQAK